MSALWIIFFKPKVLTTDQRSGEPDLADNNQTAFIHGRSIQDNIILVQESAKKLFARRQLAIPTPQSRHSQGLR
jgi:hypothetical protein